MNKDPHGYDAKAGRCHHEDGRETRAEIVEQLSNLAPQDAPHEGPDLEEAHYYSSALN